MHLVYNFLRDLISTRHEWSEYCNHQRNFSSYPRRIQLIIVAFLLVTLSIGTVYAGSIRGTIFARETNEPLPGANIFLKGTGFGAASDQFGVFTIDHVPKGEYSLHIRLLGYKKREIDHFKIESDTTTVTLDIRLEESPLSVGEVVVQARANRELESSGIRSEIEAKNIISVITAQTIERSTDRTAADVLQRVSGLSIIRDNGEGRYVIMRGLEQQYNNTLVDGIKIPSPESKDRFVPLDIFPSALFERIEVTKALTSDLAGDAIGGTTNLIFRTAPESFILTTSAAMGYNSAFGNNPLSTFNAKAVPELDPDRLHHTVTDADPTAELAPRYHTSVSDFTVGDLKFASKKLIKVKQGRDENLKI